MIFDIIKPKDPEAQAVILRQADSQAYAACDLYDLLCSCGFGRMNPGLICYGGYENAIEVTTNPEDYISRNELPR
jgi:hypothetical protein